MAAADLTAARVRELLQYNPDTGQFTWKVDRSRRKAGSVAGCFDKALGYWRICIDNRVLYGHRVAWLWVTGSEACEHVDHIDGNRAHNAWANLRLGGNGINQQNKRRAAKNNATGLLGVTAIKPKKPGPPKRFRALIGVNGAHVRLGNFSTPEEAHQAYLEAKRRLHKGCEI